MQGHMGAMRFASGVMALCVLSTTVISTRVHAAPDTAAPRVLHAVVQKGVIGQNIEVRVQFQDQSEIFEPKLYFRRVGELEYAAIDLVQGARGEWIGTIPATFVTRDIEYFLEAFDIMGNGPGRNGSPEKPHLTKIVTHLSPSEQQPRNVQQPVSGQPQRYQQPAVVEAAPPPVPVYKAWWFWTVLIGGGGAIAGVTVGVLAATGNLPGVAGPTGPITSVTLDVRAPDPRTGL